jgi:UDP:flavonoid glycosyltransferase YjiC (YdhE family)
MIPVSRLDRSRLRAQIQKLLSERCYAEGAQKIAEAICVAGGVRRAGDIIDEILVPSRIRCQASDTFSRLPQGR